MIGVSYSEYKEELTIEEAPKNSEYRILNSEIKKQVIVPQ